jgi:hypothetical protein
LLRLLHLGAENQPDGVAQPLPIHNLSFHLPAAFPGERIKLRLAARFGFFSFGCEPTSVFQTMQRGIQRSLMDLEEILRDLLQPLRDGVTVAGTQRDNFQDQQVESPSEKFCSGVTHANT